VENDQASEFPTKPLPLAEEVDRLAGRAAAGHFDELRASISELFDSSTNMAADWSTFFSQLDSNALQDFDRRTQELARQVKDNGITYNIYADQDGPQRPWSVDLFPLILGNEEWQQIESGVLQRAQLLEKIMADIYGPQQLLRDAFIPPALVQGHPGYLRAMHGVTPTGGKHLHIVALDLARGPDGNWSVISQRTQAPSGLGYLLENRTLISRQFPAAYDAMQIQPLTDAYRDLIESLKRLSPAGNDSHIALLTPGPYNETYFEHAYLARHLGLTLAEGGDLTVRDQRLYLRTLRGLEPVHVLLKRLDDEFLDPLELRADSTLGVPGLLQAVRAGNVVMANAPGSAFLESPALLGFLPALSEHLLGQPLQLPALNTWWCGERAALEAALPQLRHSTFKPTYPGSQLHDTFEPTLGSALTQAQRDEWIGRITRQPDAHTIQSTIPLSQMPTWHNTVSPATAASIVPRSFMLRVFALSNGPQSWYVLPGGLARIAMTNSGAASMQRGGSSADVWVKSSTQMHLRMPAPAAAPSTLIFQRKRLVTSRAAENLFWLGRYTERSENTLRLARLCLENLNSDNPSSQKMWSWLKLLAQKEGLVPAGVPAAEAFSQTQTQSQSSQSQSQSSTRPTAQSSSVRRRIFERTLIDCLDKHEQITSVGYNLRALKSAASSVRERLSTEQWSSIGRCVQDFSDDYKATIRQNELSPVQALAALTRASNALAGITGAQTDRMTRDDGWQLLSIGRHLERLSFLTSALELAVKAGILDNPAEDGSGFVALLALFDSTITYQAQHQQSRELAALLDLLVLDGENPRSLAWVARSLRGRLSKLAGTAPQEPDALTLSVPVLETWLLQDLASFDASGELQALRTCLAECTKAAWQVSDAISARYFSHTRDYSIQA
jgi:uncharacterized circularly permuted ATP-grasp superfamily protein/uncharacterized alpha-E superfamily protein